MAVTSPLPAARCAALALLLCLAGCTGQGIEPRPPEDTVAEGTFEAWNDQVPPYHIGQGDRLRILFPLTPELDEDALVRSDGVVTLRAAGEVSIADLTTENASAVIAQASEKRLKNPRVLISVTESTSSRIFIGGDVRTPGMFPIVGGMTVVGALQAAGGTGETALLDKVILIRRAPDNRPMMRLVNLRAGLEGYDSRQFRVYQGDILYVPRTNIGEIDLWIDQFINKFLPFNRGAGFDYTIGSSSTVTRTQ